MVLQKKGRFRGWLRLVGRRGDVVRCEGVPVPVTRSHCQAVGAGIRQVKFQVLGAEG